MIMDIKEKKRQLADAILQVLKTIFDPEIPVNVYDLGLIYEINIDDDLNAHILMTLTTPNCPVAESLPAEVKEKANGVKGINDVKVEITFDPPWTQDYLSEEAKLELGLL
jgi:FeS assembly SUF system protein